MASSGFLILFGSNFNEVVLSVVVYLGGEADIYLPSPDLAPLYHFRYFLGKECERFFLF